MRTSPAQLARGSRSLSLLAAAMAKAAGEVGEYLSSSPGNAYACEIASMSVRLAVVGRSERRRWSTPASRVAVSSTDAVVDPRVSTLSSSVSAFTRVSFSVEHALLILSAAVTTARLASVASRQARTISRQATRKPAMHVMTTAPARVANSGNTTLCRTDTCGGGAAPTAVASWEITCAAPAPLALGGKRLAADNDEEDEEEAHRVATTTRRMAEEEEARRSRGRRPFRLAAQSAY
mmetsp:Transcript_41313/g.101792  ORF Transcript_41313/g.101792 Transcript_41313/m.101792 type:complete len:236 (-) Transcript_41313:264-971(-)